MGYCGTVFSINFKSLAQLRGSKSSRTLAALTSRVHDSDDGDPDDGEAEDDDPPCPSTTDALRHIIMGERFVQEWPDSYALAMITIYHSFGRLLDNACVAPAPPEHLRAVDTALIDLSVQEPIRISSVFFRGFPLLDLRSPEPFPVLGYLTPEEVVAAPSLALDVARFPREIRRTVRQFDQWLDEAARQGEGLVGYYT